MNKNLLSFTGILMFAVFCCSCRMNVLRGEGKIITNNPAVTTFNAVEIDISLKSVINVQAGSQPSIELNGYENLLKHIVTKVENNTLRIYSDLDDTWEMDSRDVVATITLPEIKALTLNGAPDAVIHGTIGGSDFMLDVSGAADVKIDNVAVDSFYLGISGAANVAIMGGAVKHAEYEIDGAGVLKAYPLQANEAVAEISGAGTSQITALQKLDASISGAGTIKYKGHPVVTKDISGAGSITGVN